MNPLMVAGHLRPVGWVYTMSMPVDEQEFLDAVRDARPSRDATGVSVAAPGLPGYTPDKSALFADLPAFSVEQDQQPTVPEPYACLRELAHPLPQGRQRIFSGRRVDR